MKALHEILERAHSRGDLPTKFYAIVDGDYDASDDPKVVNRFTWDVYHIENYLLEAHYISAVLKALGIDGYTEEKIWERLSAAARDVVPSMLLHKMRQFANAWIINSIDLKFAPDTKTIAHDLHAAAKRSIERLNVALASKIDQASLETQEKAFQREIEESFGSGTWSKQLPGRDILRRFVNAEDLPVNYEVFRNLIMSKMAEAGYKPAGMKAIIDRIVAD